jgi:hypothetical protein
MPEKVIETEREKKVCQCLWRQGKKFKNYFKIKNSNEN